MTFLRSSSYKDHQDLQPQHKNGNSILQQSFHHFCRLQLDTLFGPLRLARFRLGFCQVCNFSNSLVLFSSPLLGPSSCKGRRFEEGSTDLHTMSKPNNNVNLLSTQPLEDEDDDLVILPDVDNSELIARFKLSLVGRLFNKERRSVEALISLLPRPSIWDVEGRVRGVDLGNHRFQFDFDSEEDLKKVLSKRPCHYNKWSFALERWTPHVGDSFPNKMTFWVSATGIPTHYWLEPIFRALGKGLGLVGKVEAKAAKFELELDAE